MAKAAEVQRDEAGFKLNPCGFGALGFRVEFRG